PPWKTGCCAWPQGGAPCPRWPPAAAPLAFSPTTPSALTASRGIGSNASVCPACWYLAGPVTPVTDNPSVRAAASRTLVSGQVPWLTTRISYVTSLPTSAGVSRLTPSQATARTPSTCTPDSASALSFIPGDMATVRTASFPATEARSFTVTLFFAPAACDPRFQVTVRVPGSQLPPSLAQ